MQLAHAAGGEAHVDARDGLGDRQLAFGHLARPAAVAHLHVRVGKGEPQVRDRAMIGRRRLQEVRILRFARRIARAKDRRALVSLDGRRRGFLLLRHGAAGRDQRRTRDERASTRLRHGCLHFAVRWQNVRLLPKFQPRRRGRFRRVPLGSA